ncbi:uncharacterized protein si:cabz01007807.1 isoform X2 [Perca fluviatilis]|uniref:uncharacterized protein si:cabz01007807.1 isoform X2 n=1 Tax=Perca fluviatilis TaxID=8168 RepID=UPI0019666ADC|nr:uncharacterized protein si:cabz01007807.1 isoform X2 [Perca fluviatilis]
MTGDGTESEVGAVDHGWSAAAAESAAEERRPSIGMLQNLRKKVSKSPFHNQYQSLVSSTSDSRGSSVNHSRNKQEPGSKGHVMEDVGRETSKEVNLDAIFAPPPEFQSSPRDLQPETKTVENGAEFSEHPKHLFQTLTPNGVQGGFQTSTLAQNVSANGRFYDVSLNSPDLFKPIPTQTQNLSKTLHLKSSGLFKDEGVNLFQAAKGEKLLHTECTTEVNPFDKSSSIFVDPFKSPSNMEDNQSPQAVMTNPSYTATTKEVDLFQTVPTKSGELFNIRENKQDPSTKEDLFGMSFWKENLDVFSSSSTNTVDPFPSPIARDLFQDLSSLDDPFGTTPSRQYDPFQDVFPGTPDIFPPFPSNTNGKDIFGITYSNTAFKAPYSTPLLNSPSEMKLDMLSSPDLSKATPSESHAAVRPESSDGPHAIFLTNPQGTESDIFQPSPFSRARNMSMSTRTSPADMTHVSTFKRPPKPLPRSRPLRPEKLPIPEKPPKPERPPPPTPANSVEPEATVPKVAPKPAFRPVPEPVIQHKTTPESKPIESENYLVFEDILYVGQEKCVEDWPEDSPQLNPDFKPSGTLRLRRESMKIKADSDGGSGEDQDDSESHGKKKDKKFRLSMLSRRGSNKFPDDITNERSKTLPTSRKSSKEYFSDLHMSAQENEDEEWNGMDYKKKPLKTKVKQLLRRASIASSVPEGKHMHGHLPRESKDDDINEKKVGKKNSIIRRWSEGTVLHDSTGEEGGLEAQHEEVDSHGFKKKKRVKIKFVPHRGYAITVEKGAHGYTPRKSSKEKLQDEVLGAHGYTPPLLQSQDDAFVDVEERGHSLHSSCKAAFMDEEHFQKTHRRSAELSGDDDPYGMEDCHPKKTTNMKPLHMGRRSSKEDMLEDTDHQKKKSSFSADELDDDYWMEDCKPKTSKHKGHMPIPHTSKTAYGQCEAIGFNHQIPQQSSNDPFAEDDFTQTGKGKDFMYDREEDEVETCKPKKPSKFKVFKKPKGKAMYQEYEDPPGATSSDYLSEAAKAEWLAAQMDEQAIAGLEDEGEDGDTDSLMEWWGSVEQWDELPSDDEDTVLKDDESKSFTILADKVHRGLRVFNKIFTERAEVLWQSVVILHAIADDINKFHHKAKIAGLTGGTATAVGGVTAITGLALSPFTFGISLIVTAVGVGVAAAGGIASASAAISDNVNNMHDRKKVEMLLEDFEVHLQTIGKVLHFVNQGLYKLRGHPLLRTGTQHYSEDWEIRRAVQMISLVDSPVMRGVELTDTAVASLQGLFTGIDKYFIKDTRELKKGCKKEVVGQIKEVANVLNDGLVELNAIREELQDATGYM